ncbi:MAG: hypothetical protein MRY83_00190 [Flavobacteriales bacterium]|nr:hypothetical protein [Flavobacteriales bacterium]
MKILTIVLAIFATVITTNLDILAQIGQDESRSMIEKQRENSHHVNQEKMITHCLWIKN